MSKRHPTINDQLMQERINFGGCVFTRFGLLNELQKRGFSPQFIDFHVFGPGNEKPLHLCMGSVTETFNEIPNEVPSWFWGDAERDCAPASDTEAEEA